jgi:two-component system NtrC family sensor kinase
VHDPYPLSLILYTLSNLLSAIIFLGLAGFVYLRGRNRLVNRLFALWSVSVSLWAFGVFGQSLAPDEEEALRWSQFLHVGAAFIPILFLHFILRYLNVKRVLLIVLYAMGAGFALAAVAPGSFLIREVSPITVFRFYPKAGPLYPGFLTYFSSCLFIAFYELWRAYHSSYAIRRNQIRYLLVATALGFSGGATAFFHVFDVPIFPYGNYGLVTVCATIIAYAIVKHRLIDTSVVLHKGLTYGLLLPAIFAPTYLVILLLIRVKTGMFDYILAGMVLTAFMAFAAGLEMLRKRIEAAVAKTVFRQQYEAYETLVVFSKSLVTILDLKTLTAEIVQTLARAVGTTVASLYLLDKEKDVHTCVSFYGWDGESPPKEQIRVQEGLAQHLAKSQMILVREEFELAGDGRLGRPILETLEVMGAELCIPLINKDCLIGFCNLGHRAGHQMYSHADLDLLSMLAQNAAIALDNARLYEDLKRSQKLIQRADRLRSLETIAGGFAHEIRNPLTSIKTFIQLAPSRRDDPEFMGEFNSVVQDDVSRIERLIEEILHYARYMEPKLSEEDLNEIVMSSIPFVEVQANQKGISITHDLAQNLPRMLLDRQQIRQVLMNLFLNAMDAITKAEGRIAVKTRLLNKPTGDVCAHIEITDTGCGISADDLEHIFDPFYTTKHESEEREGTGLGLVIVHQIIQEHGGHVEVESQVGRGTTFLITLPVNPDSSR